MSPCLNVGSALFSAGAFVIKPVVMIYPACGLAIASGLVSIEYPGEKLANEKLKQKAAEIAEKMDIVANINIYESENMEVCSIGSNLSWCNAVVNLHSKCQNFHLGHELSHVRNNHVLIDSLLRGATMVGLCLANISPAMFVTACATSYLAQNLLFRRFEKTADLEACNHCSSRDIASMIRSVALDKFKNELAREGLVNGSLWEKVRGYVGYTSNGNHLFTFSRGAMIMDHHPSNTSRLQYLKNAYYEKSTSDTIMLRLDDETELDLSLSQTIIKKIRNSPKEGTLLGTTMICLKETEKRNLEFHFDEGEPQRYSVSLDKIRELLISDDKRRIILVHHKNAYLFLGKQLKRLKFFDL